MKKTILILTTLLLTVFTTFSQVNLTQGLMAYYPFTGNANDASGNGINGTVNAATLTTDAFGVANSAYEFDGNTSYISLPYSNLYNFAPTDSFSISTWILPYQNLSWTAQSLVVKSPFNSNYLASLWNYGLYLVNNKAMTGWAGNNIVNGTTTMNNSKCWYNVVVTYKNGIWYLYVNGILEAQDLTQTHFIIQDGSNSTIAFGRKGEASGDYFKGKMDEVRIYNRNLNVAEIAALYNVNHSSPDFSFSQSVCTPKQISFKNETQNTNTFLWNFGNNTTNKINANPVVNYAAYNNYNVKLIVTQTNGCIDSVEKNIPVTTQFVDGTIKNMDTTICLGSSFKLNVVDTGLAFCWSASAGSINSSTASPTVAPTSNTTYYFNTKTLGNNLVVNGDFENGNTGFISGYNYQAPPNTLEGVYYIGNNSKAWNPGLSSCTDHTTTAGKMMLINGSPTPNVEIWKENINILPNTNYAFSCWLQSCNPTNPAQLKFSINDVQIGQLVQAPSTACNWKQFYIVWNSGNNATAKISIVNQNTIVQGNDFAIDDISFAPTFIKTDSVNVVVNNCTPCTAKPNFSFSQNTCNPKQITFKNETLNTSTFLWNFGNNTSNNTNQNPVTVYAAYNNYNVKLVVTQTNGCIDSIEKNVAVTTQLVDGIIKQIDTTICSGTTIKLNLADTGLGFCWGASSGSVISNAQSQTITPTVNTTYYFNYKTTGNNLVVNGDFESGNTDFTSSYNYQTPPRTSQSQYYIGTNPNAWFNAFVACKDHTSNGGNMMMFDGSASANTAMWKQNVAIQPNTDYLFSGWVESIVSQDAAQIVLNINGTQVGTTTTATLTACNWKQFSAIWNSGNNTTANLSITDNNLVVQGNDFAIDDISFAPIIIKTDSVNINVVDCNANPTCKGVLELHGSDRVSLPTPFTKYFSTTGFTWETWFNSSYYANNDATLDDRNKLIAMLDVPLCQDIVLGFGWPSKAPKNSLCFVVDGNGGCANQDNTPCTYKPAGGFVPNTWYHVAGVRDYTNNTSKLYVNGVLVDTKVNNHSTLAPNILTSFIIGNYVAGLDSGFAGKMDEIRIWKTVRTDAEIQANYNKCLSGGETGLVAYYRSNEASGKTLNDATPNSNNATLGTTVNFNKTDNAPIINGCLLATASFDTATICQGQTYWGHTTTNNYTDTLVNSVGCDSLRHLKLTVNLCTTASFTAPDTVCVNAPVTITNTSTNATTYNWNYCSPGVNTTVTGVNLGTLGGYFSQPVFMDYIEDGGNYYGFVVSYAPSGLVRLDFGNSLLNIPTSTNLGTLGGVLPTTNGGEGIQIIKQNGRWFAFIVGGSPSFTSNVAKIVKVDFGTNITNTNPTVTDWGNIGSMEQAHQLYMWQENTIWYGLLFNAATNTITRLNFSNDFTNTPTGVNLGNIGNLNYPSNFCIVKDNGIYRLFVTNTKGNAVSRLDFGSSLLNTPIGTNLGNISNLLNFPRAIILKSDCDGIYGYLSNQNTSDIVKISMPTYTSVPTGISLGNIGSLNIPQSFSKEFYVGKNIYTFIVNTGSNTLSRLQFSGCNNSSASNSTSPTPPSISYNAAGTYNINLIVDEGLSTQSFYCKKIVVKNCPINVVASFTAPDTVCVNTPVTITNTSTNATTYNWNYCSPSVNTIVTGVNLGTLGGNFKNPVFMDYVEDGGNFYGFVVNYLTSTISRLDFGNSLLNTPTSTFIGNPNGILPTPNGAEDIKIIIQNGKWFAFIVGGSPTLSGSLPKLVKLDFGTNITNTNPTVTDWGNIGNLEQPHQLYMWQENTIWYGTVFNAGNNTITRFNFTNDFNNTPIATNLGNIGNLNFPTSFCVVNDNGIHRIFVSNTKGNSISRLDFGNSLLNTPTGINLGNTSGLLNFPRGIILKSDCEGVYGYLSNQNTSDIIKISMPNYTSVPTGVSLGNIGSLNIPHSFTKEFSIGSNIYCFVPNTGSNTLSRLQFSGCNNSSTLNSTSPTPPTISYNAAGTYNINLTVDEGLPTQSFYCKKVVVVNAPTLTITSNKTSCYDSAMQLSAAGASSYSWSPKTWLNDSTIANPIATPQATVKYIVSAKNSTGCTAKDSVTITVLPKATTTKDTIKNCGAVVYNFIIYSKDSLVSLSIKNYLGCDSIIQQHQIIVTKEKRDTISKSICTNQFYLGHNTTGFYPIDTIHLAGGCDSINIVNLTVDNFIRDTINPIICFDSSFKKHNITGVYFDTIHATTFCDTLQLINLTVKKPNPTLPGDTSICSGDILKLYPGKFVNYLWSNNKTTTTINVQNVGTYWVTVKDSFGCQVSDTFKLISLYTKPKNFLPNELSVCTGERFTVPNYISYQWITGETTATIQLNGLPNYWVKVTDKNYCVGSDTMKIVYAGFDKFAGTNAFTPNNDGYNDFFKPLSGSCITAFSMLIYNRWGQLVYKTYNAQGKGWDGNVNGSQAPIGVYYYIITYRNINDEQRKQSGSVTLLR